MSELAHTLADGSMIRVVECDAKPLPSQQPIFFNSSSQRSPQLTSDHDIEKATLSPAKPEAF
jgi:hypothetical protein